jgi:glycosyltransferase involved in cell wall biosynthesis
VLDDNELRARLVKNGLELVQRFSWPNVGEMWLREYTADAGAGRDLAPTDGGGASG